MTGQIKIIVHDTDGGSTVCTPADPMGYADLNFVVVGDTATLIWAGSAWAVLASHKAASDSGIVDIAN